MNFEKANDFLIGNRIKNYRKSENLTQEKLCDIANEEYVSIDKYRLSNLENGKRFKNKNPHFLSISLIEYFSNKLDVDKKELLFGNDEERKNLIKLMILNIFMNGTKKGSMKDIEYSEQNPIFDLKMEDKEFFRLSISQLSYNSEFYKIAWENYFNLEMNNNNIKSKKLLERDKAQISNILCNIDDFFFNIQNAKIYNLFMDERTSFSLQSSIILKCLFGNFSFANSFLIKCDNIENYYSNGYEVLNKGQNEFYIDNFLNAKGNFSSMAINYKEHDYQNFINAFNEFFEMYWLDFCDYFEENIFSKSLKELSNEYVNEILMSKEFISLLNEIYLKDQFSLSRMNSHNYVRTRIQKMSILKEVSNKLNSDVIERSRNSKSKLDEIYEWNLKNNGNEKEYDILKYLYDIQNMTELFAYNSTKKNSAGLFLPSYFDITPLR